MNKELDAKNGASPQASPAENREIPQANSCIKSIAPINCTSSGPSRWRAPSRTQRLGVGRTHERGLGKNSGIYTCIYLYTFISGIVFAISVHVLTSFCPLIHSLSKSIYSNRRHGTSHPRDRCTASIAYPGDPVATMSLVTSGD